MGDSMSRVSIRPSIRNPQRFTDAALDAVDLDDAKAKWAAVRVAHGFKPTTPNLIPTKTGNAKLQKTAATYGLSLAPARLAGVGTVCAWATYGPDGCVVGCLNTAGRGTLADVQRGRIVRTVFAARYPLEFRALLRHEIRAMAKRHGTDPFYLRLNVLSDIHYHREPWAKVAAATNGRSSFSEGLPATCRPYGYTKDSNPATMADATAAGHCLTYSVNNRDRTPASILPILDAGGRAAVVLAHGERWPTAAPFPIVDGDAHDLRPNDPPGTVAILRAKGPAKKSKPAADGSSFVKSADWFAA